LLRTVALVAAGAVVLDDGSSTVVYLLAAAESAISTLMRPAQNSLLPALSRTPEELTSTNLALSVIESGGVFLGPLIGAVLLSGSSVGIVFFAAAAAYLVSTLLLLPVRVPGHVLPEAAGERRSILAEFVTGTRAVAAEPNLRLVVLLYGAQNLVAGSLNVLVVVTALQLLDMGQVGVGALTAAVGIGGVVGGAVAFTRLRRGRHGTDLRLGLILWGIPLVLLSFVSTPAAALVLLGFVGVAVTVVDVAAITLLQRTARGELLPHALGTLQAVFVFSVATGTLLAPVLVSSLGVRGALLATGAFLPVLAITLNRQLQRLDAGLAQNPELVGLLAQISIFAPLSESALEHLASLLTARDLPSGGVAFSQGDEGDGFYIVESGLVAVEVAGVTVATLGPGEYFGEIALLRDVPRTATIRATTDVRLQRLDRAPFIGTVTGNSTSTDAADAVVGSRLGMRSGFTAV
jgi:MFS family permease